MRPELMDQIDKKVLNLALVMTLDEPFGGCHRFSPGKLHPQIATTACTSIAHQFSNKGTDLLTMTGMSWPLTKY